MQKLGLRGTEMADGELPKEGDVRRACVPRLCVQLSLRGCGSARLNRSARDPLSSSGPTPPRMSQVVSYCDLELCPETWTPKPSAQRFTATVVALLGQAVRLVAGGGGTDVPCGPEAPHEKELQWVPCPPCALCT